VGTCIQRGKASSVITFSVATWIYIETMVAGWSRESLCEVYLVSKMRCVTKKLGICLGPGGIRGGIVQGSKSTHTCSLKIERCVTSVWFRGWSFQASHTRWSGSVGATWFLEELLPQLDKSDTKVATCLVREWAYIEARDKEEGFQAFYCEREARQASLKPSRPCCCCHWRERFWVSPGRGRRGGAPCMWNVKPWCLKPELTWMNQWNNLSAYQGKIQFSVLVHRYSYC